MHPLPYEKRRDYHIPGPRQLIATLYPRLLLQKNRLHTAVQIHPPDCFGHALHGLARILVLLGSVPGDKQRDVRRPGRAWKRKRFHHFARALKHDFSHARMRADWLAVKPFLLAPLEHSLSGRKSQLPRDHPFAKITFAHEHRNEEYPSLRQL